MKLRAIAAAAACASTLVLAQFAPTYADGMPNDDDENFNPVPSVPGVPAPGVKQPAPIKQNTKPTGISAPLPAPVATPPAAPAPEPAPAPSSPPPATITPEIKPSAPATAPAPPSTPVVAPTPTPAPVAPVAPTVTKPVNPAVSQPAPATVPTATGTVPQQTLKEVLDVEVTIQKTNPRSAIVTVRGSADTGGWTAIQLKPLQTVATEIGMRSYLLVGTKPTGFATQAITPVTATITIDPLPANVRAIRVLSETTEIVQNCCEESK